MQIDPNVVRLSLGRAIERCDLALSKPGLVKIEQREAKQVAVLLADELIGAAGPSRRATTPDLWANRIDGVRDRLQFTQAGDRGNECMVDVFVCEGVADPYVTRVTVECEASEKYRIDKRSSSASCDYLWDLFKLLQVPSPVRLFIARHAEKRHSILAARVGALVRTYSSRYADGDRIFSLLLPTARFDPKEIVVRGWAKRKNKLIELW